MLNPVANHSTLAGTDIAAGLEASDRISVATSHSAFVILELRAAGQIIPLSQIAHDFAIPVQSVDLPTCEAEILMFVDGELTRMPVFLSEGGQIGQRRISISKSVEDV